MKPSYQNILVIKLKHIGDVLVATPVFTALKETYPDSRLSVLVNKGTEDMVTLNPAVDEVIVLDRGAGQGVVRRAAAQLRFIMDLRGRKFDLVIELSAGDRGAFLSLTSGAKERIGIEPHQRSFLGRHHAFTKLLKVSTTAQHMVDYNLAFLSALGIEPAERRQMTIYWSKEDVQTCKKLLSDRGLKEGDPYIVLHPTSRWLFKTWNSRGYALLCDHIAGRYGISVIVTSGPDEKERARVEEILSLARSRPVDLSGALSLKQLACCISNSILFIGVDSAPMHIAAAAGTPVIVLFGPSGDHMWGPWGNGHIVIKKGWDCQPCGRDGCNGSKISRCLEAITPEEVCQAVDAKLKETRLWN